MKNYSEITWQDLNNAGHISPVRGINMVTTMQVAEYLGVTPKELSKPRGRAASDLKRLGMFTASIKSLLPKIPDAKTMPEFEYALPLEDGGATSVPRSPIVYYTAAAVARLADEVKACSMEAHGVPPLRLETEDESRQLHPEENNAGQNDNVEGANGMECAKAANLTVSDSPNNLMVFTSKKFGNVRTITEGGKTLFCGSDVAKALGYKNPTKALADHCKGTVERRTNDSLGRRQTMKFITEGDIYRLAARSELPGADEFESWIFDEVLPSIRRHGMYVTERTLNELMADPDTAIQLFRKIKEEQEKGKALQEKVSVLEKQNDGLKCENHMLAKREQTWNARDIVVRLVRMYGYYVYGGNFSYGWSAFYRELYYKKGINLKARPGSGFILDRVKDTEWEDLISVAAAMCDEFVIDFSWAVNDTNAAAVQACR